MRRCAKVLDGARRIWYNQCSHGVCGVVFVSGVANAKKSRQDVLCVLPALSFYVLLFVCLQQTQQSCTLVVCQLRDNQVEQRNDGRLA
jgi:hypothetical protein